MPPSYPAPKKQPASRGTPRARATNTIQKSAGRPPAHSTILLVDDDPAVLKSVGRVLAGEGWTVVSAANGEEALERLAERQPDLLITDLSMGDVSGWDLLFHENLQRPGLPIFVITALPPPVVGGADRFATEFFQKPLDLEALVTAIRRALHECPALQPQR